jgi:hypothetical protein
MRTAAEIRRAPHYTRAQWDELLTFARRLARGNLGEADLTLASFRHEISRCSPERFPIQSASAVLMAESFARIGRAFVIAGLPEDRELIGASLGEAASCLQELLARQRAAEAERGRRVMGEKED